VHRDPGRLVENDQPRIEVQDAGAQRGVVQGDGRLAVVLGPRPRRRAAPDAGARSAQRSLGSKARLKEFKQ
jgi:hypothetical protein